MGIEGIWLAAIELEESYTDPLLRMRTSAVVSDRFGNIMCSRDQLIKLRYKAMSSMPPRRSKGGGIPLCPGFQVNLTILSEFQRKLNDQSVL